jgi:hypothetical protein
MAATLLYVGDEEAVRCDLAFVPPSSPVVRVDTIAGARRYLLRDPAAKGVPHLIAYGPSIAAQFDQPTPPDAALPELAWGPAIVLYHPEIGTPAFTREALRKLHVIRAVPLPIDWPWLLEQLAAARPRTTTR